jgi:hypothetical protein
MGQSRGKMDGITAWARREPWRERMAEIVGNHIDQACAMHDIEVHDLFDLIGDAAFTATDCAFEDLCTLTWDDGSNLVTDYLKRRGWKEAATTRDYLEALRNSVMSLYEVIDVTPGDRFVARDLVRGGDPVHVIDETATRRLVPWDIVAARILTVRGSNRLTTAVLAFDRDLAQDLLEVIDRAKAHAAEVAAELTKNLDYDLLRARFEEEFLAQNAILAMAAASITNFWLDEVIASYLAPFPQLVNQDGEAVELLALHYRLLPGTSVATVADALSNVAALRLGEDGHSWSWIKTDELPPTKGRRKETGDQRSDHTIYGHLALISEPTAGDILTVFVNSEPRLERIRELLEPVLGNMVGEPLVEHLTPEQALAQIGDPEFSGHDAGIEGLDQGELTKVVHEALDRRYRASLDEKIPALDNKTPRQAIRSAKGREKVANWLKSIEQTHARVPADDPMHGYDFRWMWEELGILKLRK